MSKAKEVALDLMMSNVGKSPKEIYEYAMDNTRPPRVLFPDIWSELRPEFKETLNRGLLMEAINPAKDLDNDEKMTALDFLNESKKLVQGIFVKAKEEDERRGLYRILDAKRQIVSPIPKPEQKARVGEAIRQQAVEKDGMSYKIQDVNEMTIQYLDCKDDFVPKPEPMLQAEVPGWCLHRPDVVPEDIPIPTWTSVFIRMDDPKAFAAWIWGVYVGIYEGRQILWLYGPTGEDGKSVVLNIIGKILFGPALGAIDNTQLGKKSGFLNSFFLNTRLVIYPDCKNPKALMYEAFQSIANGGLDTVVIEPKGEKAFFANLKARAAIASNHMPQSTGDHFSTSRLLLITISEATEKRTTPSEYGGRLTDELPGFLLYAKNAYEELCLGDYKIRCNDAAKKMANEAVSQFEEQWEYYFEKVFIYKEGATLAGYEFIDSVKEVAGIRNNQEVKSFKDYLLREYKIYDAHTENGRVYHNIALRDVGISSEAAGKVSEE